MCLFKISFAYATDADVQAVSPFKLTVKNAAMNIFHIHKTGRIRAPFKNLKNHQRVASNQILVDQIDIGLLGGKINGPSLGKSFSLLFLQATPSFPSPAFEGLFELTRHNLQGASTCLVCCFWNYRETRTQEWHANCDPQDTINNN